MAVALLVAVPLCAVFFLSGWQVELIRRFVVLNHGDGKVQWNLHEDETLADWLTKIWNGPVEEIACHYPDDDAWDLIHVLPRGIRFQVVTEPEYLAEVLRIMDDRQPPEFHVMTVSISDNVDAEIWESQGLGSLCLLRTALDDANANAVYGRQYFYLMLDDYPHTAAVVDQLKYPELLQSVALSGRYVGDEGIAVLARRIMEKPNPRFGSLSALKGMRLDQTQVTDKGIRQLQSIPSLDSLTIKSGRMTGDGFSGWTTLVTLKIENTPLTPSGIRAVCSLPQLSSLTLDCTPLGSEGFDALQNATVLSELELRNPSDYVLRQLAGSKITDLRLEGDTYSLDAVKALSKIKTLTSFSVINSAFDSQPFEALRADMPQHIEVHVYDQIQY